MENTIIQIPMLPQPEQPSSIPPPFVASKDACGKPRPFANDIPTANSQVGVSLINLVWGKAGNETQDSLSFCLCCFKDHIYFNHSTEYREYYLMVYLSLERKLERKLFSCECEVCVEE